jgi:hypothetical protein
MRGEWMKTWKPLIVVVGAALVQLWACREARAGMSVLYSEDNFKVSIGIEADTANPLTGKVVLDLEALKGWKVSPEAPLIIELTPSASLTFTKNKFRNADMQKPKAEKPRFEIPFTAQAKGSHDLKLKFDVVICTEKMCQKKRFEKTYSLNAG